MQRLGLWPSVVVRSSHKMTRHELSKILGVKVSRASLIKIAKGKAFFEVMVKGRPWEIKCSFDKAGKVKEAVLS